MSEIFEYARIPLAEQSVIEASAGTGKTYSITQMYLRFLLEKRIPLEKILVVTFTEAATAELRERIRNAIVSCVRKCKGEAVAFVDNDPYLKTFFDPERSDAAEIRSIVENAATAFDESAIFTIHGFCRRVLRDHAFEYSTIFDAELLGNTDDLIREVTLDFFRKKFYRATRFALAWRKKQGINAESLAGILRETLPHSGLRIVPGEYDTAIVDSCGKRIAKLFASFKKKWKKDSASLESVMNENISALNANSYSKGKTSGIIRDVTSALESDDYSANLSALEYFCPRKIADRTKKNCDSSMITSHPLAIGSEQFMREYYVIHAELDQAEAHLRAEYVDFAKRAFSKEKAERNLWSFDDLISQVRNGLVSEKGEAIASSLRSRYAVALIDEFQDTDPAQCDIFEKIFNHESSLLFYIGDPKQAIYSFRGADVYAYIRAKRGKTEYIKNENWRSNKPLIDGINALFARSDPFMLGDRVEYHPVRAAAGMTLEVEGDRDESVILWAVPPEESKPLSDGKVLGMLEEAVTGEISDLVNKGSCGKALIRSAGKPDKALRPGDIAVIVRRNSDAKSMKECLRAAGVPSVIAQGGSVFKSPVRSQLDVVLCAIMTCREQFIRAALATELFAMNARDIEALSEDDAEREKILELFRTHSSLWESRGFMPMITSLFSQRRIPETLASGSDGTRKVVDLLHLVELYHRAEMDDGLGPSELLAWSRLRAEESPRSDEHQFRLETDEDAVKIITVHRSKGLEYPVVFCCVGWEMFESPKRKDKRYFRHDEEGAVCDFLHASDKNSPEYDLAGDELAAENIRFLYVALTRASCRVYALGGVSAGYHQSAMAYLLHHSRADDGAGRKEFESVIKKLPFEEIMADMNSLASPGSLRVEILPEGRGSDMMAGRNDTVTEFVPRAARRTLRDDWKISSFSYIVSSRSDDQEHAYDEGEYAKKAVIDDGYPKGAAAGNCIHEIFEKTDFSSYTKGSASGIIDERLRKYGLHSERNAEWISRMVSSVLGRKIPLMGVSFSETKPSSIMREMEFYFPAKMISDREFRALLSSVASAPGFNGGKVRSLDTITFERFAGFLRGFIDLVVEHEGKYYIVDWKSNYLGPDIADYDHDALCEAMDSHLYTVQALIYTLALDRHLAARLPGYEYETHFGGIIYVFVRGVNPDGEEGLWQYRPEGRAVKELREGFIREGSDE